jgi:hypothetical protein
MQLKFSNFFRIENKKMLKNSTLGVEIFYTQLKDFGF